MKPSSSLLEPKFAALVALLGLTVVLLVATLIFAVRGSHCARGGDEYRDVASRLKASGVDALAADYYERYLDRASISRDEKAKIAVAIGELLENAGEPQKALGFYFRTEIYAPGSESQKKAAQKSVAILETLQKFAAAKNLLRSSTALEPGKDKPQGAVTVAKIGPREITMTEVDSVIDTLSPQLKADIAQPGKKVEFVKKYVAEELIYQKALRLKLDDTPDFKKRLADVMKQLLVQKIVEDEVGAKITVDEADLRNFFTTNKEKYALKDRVVASMIKAKDQAAADDIEKRLEKKEDFAALAMQFSMDDVTKSQGGRLPVDIQQGDDQIGLGTEAMDALFKTEPGKATKPLLIAGNYYIFFVKERKPRVEADFDKLKTQVEYDYKIMKGRGLYQKLVDDSVVGEDVKIIDENIK